MLPPVATRRTIYQKAPSGDTPPSCSNKHHLPSLQKQPTHGSFRCTSYLHEPHILHTCSYARNMSFSTLLHAPVYFYGSKDMSLVRQKQIPVKPHTQSSCGGHAIRSCASVPQVLLLTTRRRLRCRWTVRCCREFLSVAGVPWRHPRSRLRRLTILLLMLLLVKCAPCRPPCG